MLALYRLILFFKFRKYVLKVNINLKLNFKFLRHNLCKLVSLRGILIYEVQKLLRYSVVSVTQIYIHLQLIT